MLVSFYFVRPFLCRSRPTNTYSRVVFFNSSGRSSFQGTGIDLTTTFVGLNIHMKSTGFGFQCRSVQTCSLCLTIYKPNNIIICNDLCRHRSSFNVRSLWEEEKTENNSKLQLKTKENKPTSAGEPKITSLKFSSDRQEELLNCMLDQANRQTHNVNIDWSDIKKSTLEIRGCIDEENIDAIIMNKCCCIKSLTLGKSFFNYLKSSHTQINRATYGNYLRLFHDCSSECTEDDLKEVFDVYQELQHVYHVLDSNTAEKVILALSITKHWKEYVKLFEIIKKIYYPTTIAYTAVVKAAFNNGEFNLGWNLMEEMQIRGINVPDYIFIYLLETSRESTKDEVLTKVLKFMSKFNIKPSVDLSAVIKQTFEGNSIDRRGTYTSVLRSGTCKRCGTELEPAQVSHEDYEELKAAFLNPVLIGKDIFLKTKPEEFNKFLAFLEKAAPFDVVLDGLNIAFKHKRNKISSVSFAHQLKCVVEHFVSLKNKVLVLGRNHMTKWPAKDMQSVYDNADVFLADDISQDDPFLLYATLYSGLGTRFLSQDMMRGHKFLLADSKLQTTFQRWQAQHQYFLNFVDDNGRVYLRDPVPFVQSIQQNHAGDWHIPYVKKEDLTTHSVVDNFHRYWLCLTNKPSLQKRPAGYNAERRFPTRY